MCFNKPITSVDPLLITLGLYRASGSNNTLQAITANVSTTNCADVAYPKSNVNPYTHLRISSGAVTSTTGAKSISDATPLIGSATTNGTAGRTTGPDLTGVQATNDNIVRFLFDQNVSAAGAATNYQIVDAATNTAQSGTGIVSIDKNVVTVSGYMKALTAVKAVVSSATAVADADGDTNRLLSLPFPGQAETTSGPDLQSASVSGDASTVDFVFDGAINPATLLANGFSVTRSDGTVLDATSPQVVNNNTVRTQLPQGANQAEYLVTASAIAAAASGNAAPAIGPNTASGVPIGGNRGAFASGFTTGPDALSVTFNKTTGVASVLLDQRFGQISTGSVRLYDAAGKSISTVGSPSTITGIGGPAGRVTAALQFTPDQLANATAIQLGSSTFITYANVGNVTQTLSATPPAASRAAGRPTGR